MKSISSRPKNANYKAELNVIYIFSQHISENAGNTIRNLKGYAKNNRHDPSVQVFAQYHCPNDKAIRLKIPAKDEPAAPIHIIRRNFGGTASSIRQYMTEVHNDFRAHKTVLVLAGHGHPVTGIEIKQTWQNLLATIEYMAKPYGENKPAITHELQMAIKELSSKSSKIQKEFIQCYDLLREDGKTNRILESGLTLKDIRKEIEGYTKEYGKLSMIVLESCCLGNVEIAYEFRDTADILLSSCIERQPSELENHRKWISHLNTIRSFRDSKEMAIQSMKNISGDSQFMAHNLSGIEKLADALECFVTHITSSDRKMIEEAYSSDAVRRTGEKYSTIDLDDFMEALRKAVLMTPLEEHVKNVQTNLNTCRISYRPATPRPRNLGIYFPDKKHNSSRRTDPRYNDCEMEFLKKCKWDSFLKQNK
jgi:hypothetical protein